VNEPEIASAHAPESAMSATEAAARIAEWVPSLDWVVQRPVAVTLLALAALFGAAIVVHLISHLILLRALVAIAKRSSISWDDVLVRHHVFHRVVRIPSVVVVQSGVGDVPGLPTAIGHVIATLASIVTVVLVARVVIAFLGAMNDVYARHVRDASRRPIKGYVQVGQLLTYIVAGILVIAQLFNQSPIYLLSGLGAMTAVLLLIFRDTLLSLVAGVQLTSNDLLRIGDWIEMPTFGADGDVVDIALNVVKVQNWDRTFTVIPTHKFLEHSFKNWRGMFDAGGRRIMRSIHIDLATVRFLSKDEIARLRRIVLLRDYLDEKLAEITQHNETRVPSEFRDVIVNQRALTNVGTLRAYINAYLRQHPSVHQNLTIMTRQLQPTPQGLPLQLYLFTNDTKWVNYERVQADIFDHLFAILPEFGLRAFQEPSGNDVAQLKGMAPLAEPTSVRTAPN
jgi:miniconductance mechanosensitive channel